MKSFILLFSLCFLFLNAFSQKPSSDTLSFEIKDIIFEVNQSTTRSYNDNLNSLSQYLLRNTESILELGAYTDKKGGVKYNRNLAEKRITFVKNYLLKKGVPAKQLLTKIYSSNSKYNRRVAVKMIKAGNDKLIVKQNTKTKNRSHKTVYTSRNIASAKHKKSHTKNKQSQDEEYISSKELKSFSDVLSHQEYISYKELSTFTEILMCQKQLSHREGDKDYSFDNATPCINKELDTTNVRGKIVEFSKRFLKLHYKWGGTTPQGFDCSGFTRYIYGNTTGIELPRTSSEQANMGEQVEVKNAQPGDLVFFGTKKHGQYRTSHAGIIVANNNGKLTMIHSSRTGIRVEDDILTSDYYSKKFLFVRRVMN